mgnify:CR=1 FL=1
MAEYVEREALLAHIKDLPTWWADAGGYYSGAQKLPDGLFEPEDIIASIENAPAADVAPVVRCRECKYYDPEDWGGITCKADGGMTDPDDDSFCSQGERGESNADR